MAQIVKSEANAAIKCQPAKIYDFLKNNMNQFNIACPLIYKSSQLLEGECGQIGNVILLEYVLDEKNKNKSSKAKVKTEAIDDEKRSITFRIIEGDVLEVYTSFTSKATFTDGCVNWTIEVQKANDSAPNPDNYAALSIESMKALDRYLASN